MATVPETAEHQLFRIELWGDTAVIVPRGDAVGFTTAAVNSELATVNEILRRDSVKHLVIDLGAANYFGSIVLGALVHLGHVVQAKHGRIALAAASEDMQDVLRLMKLDQMWEFYPHERAALRAIAAIPVRQRLWAQRRVAASVLAVAAIVLAIVFFPRINYGKRYYVEVHKLWREAEARRDLAGEEEWQRFLQRSENKLEPMLQHMLRRSDAGRGSQAEIYLIYVIRDYWKKALDRNNPNAKMSEQLLKHYLRWAEADLEHRPIPMEWSSAGNDDSEKTGSK